jgi:hypothetical protein
MARSKRLASHANVDTTIVSKHARVTLPAILVNFKSTAPATASLARRLATSRGHNVGGIVLVFTDGRFIATKQPIQVPFNKNVDKDFTVGSLQLLDRLRVLFLVVRGSHGLE